MIGAWFRSKKGWVFLAIAVIVAMTTTRYLTLAHAKPIWKTVPIEEGNIQVSVTSTGILQAVVTIQVGTQVSGTISELKADFNSHVKKGQVIARLDTTLLVAALSDAQSNLARTSAQAQQAGEELRRTTALFARDLVSQSELDVAKANAEVAKANLNSARSQVQRARINLRLATITSPIDGIVLSRAVDVGQTVAASFNTPTLFTLAGDLREMQVQAAVDEADIGVVKAGQAATFTVDAYPNQNFSGVVKQIRLQPKVDQNVVTYDVVIQVPNPDLRLMPGMTASLTIAIEHHENVLILPTAALHFRPPNDSTQGKKKTNASWSTHKPVKTSESSGKIFVLDKGLPKPLRIKIGLNDGSHVEVMGDSIAAGLEVITSYEIPGAQATAAKTSAFGSTPGGPRGPR